MVTDSPRSSCRNSSDTAPNCAWLSAARTRCGSAASRACASLPTSAAKSCGPAATGAAEALRGLPVSAEGTVPVPVTVIASGAGNCSRESEVAPVFGTSTADSMSASADCRVEEARGGSGSVAEAMAFAGPGIAAEGEVGASVTAAAGGTAFAIFGACSCTRPSSVVLTGKGCAGGGASPLPASPAVMAISRNCAASAAGVDRAAASPFAAAGAGCAAAGTTADAVGCCGAIGAAPSLGALLAVMGIAGIAQP